MPTVHLSLPDSVYRKLKERAGELGIQVTDLIKIYIKNGLEGSIFRSRELDSIEILAKRIENVEKEFRTKTIMLEGRYREVMEILNYIIERVEQLEDILATSSRKQLSYKEADIGG